MSHQPKIHYDQKEIIDGKVCYKAEITDEAGTHSIYIEKDKVKQLKNNS